MVEPIASLYPVAPTSVYWENRIGGSSEGSRTMSISVQPLLVYDKHGNLIENPDRSWGIAEVA